MKKIDLLLAIDDDEFGPEIRKTRITTPGERTRVDIIRTIREQMEVAGALDGDGDKARKNRAKLELALDDGKVLSELMAAWLSKEERLKLGAWPEEGDELMEYAEAELIRRFIVATYRGDLAGSQLELMVR